MSNDELVIKNTLTDEEYNFILFAFKVADEQGSDYRNIEFFMSDFVESIGISIDSFNWLNNYADKLISSLHKKRIIIEGEGVEIHESILSSSTHDTRSAKITLLLNIKKKHLLL
ncbi:hypothetical protein [Virgibacillus kimchii]